MKAASSPLKCLLAPNINRIDIIAVTLVSVFMIPGILECFVHQSTFQWNVSVC